MTLPCHLQLIPVYYPPYALFSPLKGVLLEQLFSFQDQLPFPAEAVRALMLNGGVLVGKFSCPKMCQAAWFPGQTSDH